VNATSPVPLLAELLIVSQEAFEDEVHVQPGEETTPTEPDPPPGGAAPAGDRRAYAHAVPACDTFTNWPPILIDAERGLSDPLLADVTETVPAPVPEVALLKLSQDARVDAVQLQAALLVMIPMLPVPPAEAKGLPSSDVSRLISQLTPGCVISKNWPPMFIAPERETVVELGSTV